MKHKSMSKLVFSLIGVAALCVVVFSWVTDHMRSQGAMTIREIGVGYMSAMSRQVAMHFGSTLESLLDQVDAIAKDSADHSPERMAESARARGFTHLALYQPDAPGGPVLRSLNGGSLTPDEGEGLWDSLAAGERRIAMGEDENGQEVILLTAPGPVTLGGESGEALVAGIRNIYIANSMKHELDAGMIERYLVIRRDGSYVDTGVLPGQAYAPVGRTNYFTELRMSNQSGVEDPESYIEGLAQAMDSGEDFSSQISTEGGQIHVFCTGLPNTDWYLLLMTPYTAVNDSVDSLGEAWTATAFGGCAVILLALLAVFAWYIATTRRQLRELDEARQSAERASLAKSQFLSNMSHDIRTPMNGIVGMTAIASANLDDPKQVENCLKKISFSSRHLLGLINDILDMAKIDSGKMTLSIEQVSLREIMQELVSIVQQQVKLKQQNFGVYIDGISVEDVCCDSVRLRQIFLNLLSNAIKFTPEGGTIRVKLLEEPSPKGDGYVRSRLWVEDNGMGMTEEFRAHIFESFVREDGARVRKAQGAGVGMAITKHIVDAMGGEIEVKSQVGKGTVVEVVLDLEKAQIQEADMKLPDWSMLVVDDDELLCASAVATLKSLGVAADRAMSAQEALDKARERKAKDGRGYEVILVDWRLPDMDGVQTAGQLREICGEDACILLTSAYDRDEIDQAVGTHGINGEIAKPLFKSTLYYGLMKYKAAEEALLPQEDQVGFMGWRVLVAEDNDLNWEIAEELLSELGMTLERAENGRICTEMFAASDINGYDAVLMDLRMPEMTGYEATEAIRAMDRPDAKTLPIIAMSADTFPEDVQRCLDCGMNAHSAKPIDVKQVALLLKKYQRKKR